MKLVDDILRRITNADKSYQQNISRKIAPSFLIQGVSVSIAFLTNVLLARFLGASDYGAFSYAFSLVTLLSTVAVSGITTLNIKNVSIYKNQKQYAYLKGLMKWPISTVLTISLAIAFLSGLVYYNFQIVSDAHHNKIIALALVAVPLFSLLLVNQSLLQGSGEIVLSQAPERLIRPALFLLMAGIYFFSVDNPSLLNMVVFNLLCLTGAYFASALYVKRKIAPLCEGVTPDYDEKIWRSSTFSLFILTFISVINSRVDILMLGTMRSSADVGIYNTANRLAEIISFSLLIANIAIAPAIAHLYSSGDKKLLQNTVTRTIRIIFILSFPITLIMIFFGEQVLSIFGSEFTAGHRTLIILSLAQTFNVVAGPAGCILSMTGNERFASISMAVSILTNILLGLVLIPYAGYEGAAYATAVSIVVWNTLMVIFAKIKTGIRPTLF